MTRRKDIPYLRLVSGSAVPDGAAVRTSGGARGVQLCLFHEPSPALLGFLNTTATKSEMFTKVLREVRPVWLLDLRPSAVFDLDPRFSRRRAFDLFQEVQTTYRDVARDLRIQERRDARLNAGEISQALSVMMRSTHPGPKGPILFLLDDEDMMATAVRVLPRTLEPRPKTGWQVHVFGPYTRPDRRTFNAPP